MAYFSGGAGKGFRVGAAIVVVATACTLSTLAANAQSGAGSNTIAEEVSPPPRHKTGLHVPGRCHPRHHRKCKHKACHCPPGPAGPTGPAGPAGPAGPPGQPGSSAGIDTAFQGNNKFVGNAPGNGSTLVRDPRTTPRWHDISGLSGYPGNVTDVSLAVMGNRLHVTVRSATGRIAQTSCRVNPQPGTGGNPAWPGNCGPFVDMTPPA